MKKREVAFWNLVKSHLPGDVERVENMAGTGTPDVDAAWFRDYGVELKAQPDKEDADIEKLLEPSQRVWMRRRCPQGTLVFIIVRFLHRIVIARATATGMEPVAIVKKEGNKFNWPHFEAAIQKAIKG